MAWSWSGLSVAEKASLTAPQPRPPQPINARRIVLIFGGVDPRHVDAGNRRARGRHGTELEHLSAKSCGASHQSGQTADPWSCSFVRAIGL